MWIRTTRESTTRLYNADLMDEPVTFNENGTAQVPKAVGEALVDRYDAIESNEDETDNEV